MTGLRAISRSPSSTFALRLHKVGDERAGLSPPALEVRSQATFPSSGALYSRRRGLFARRTDRRRRRLQQGTA